MFKSVRRRTDEGFWPGRVDPTAERERPVAHDDDPLSVARERVAALRVSLEAAQGQPVRLVETHICWVLLAGSLAFKLKKPVRLPLLEFTTLVSRRRFREEELRLNRRLAPSQETERAGAIVVDAAQPVPPAALAAHWLAATVPSRRVATPRVA